MNKLIIFTIIISICLITPSNSYAQSVPLRAQKQVVSNFKTNPNSFPFPQSDCSNKYKGDANCDNQINLFDLSIWQIETVNNQGLRADFNNDGVVNLKDFGIWRNNYYESPAEGNSIPQAFINFFKSIFEREALAQQNTGLQTMVNSLPISSSGGDSIVFNQNSDGSTSQIQFDSNSNPVTSQVFDSEGKPVSQTSFLSSGDEIVTMSQDGISIQTLKKVDGPVVVFFKDGGGNILTVKSWPNLASVENNEPPLAVTVPTKDQNLLTLNISPNNSTIVSQTDSQGNIINLAQSRPDGAYISEDLKYQIRTQANKNGLSIIQMPNDLGGTTTYNFYQSGLFAVGITDSSNNYYIAKPLDSTADNWTLTSTVSGQTTQSQTTDPTIQTGANTPSPKQIIEYINYYKSLPTDNSGLTFNEGFGSNSQINREQINQANEILKVETADLPSQTVVSNSIQGWSFGIREAAAQQLTERERNEVDVGGDDDNRGNSRNRTGSEDREKQAAASAASVVPSNNITTTARAGIAPNTGNVTVAADGTQNAQVNNAAGAEVARGSAGNESTNRTAGETDINAQIHSVISRFIPITSGLGTPGSKPQPAYDEQKGSCFLAGTLISTPNGPIAIETLKPGMKVYSLNEQTGEKEVSDFDELDINLVSEYLIINKKIHTTTYHPFYTSNNGLLSLIKAGKLKIGDLLIDEQGKQIPIESIQTIKEKRTVYNLTTVTPNNNFYAEGFLVHNYQKDPDKNDTDPGSGHEQQNLEASLGPAGAEGGWSNGGVSGPGDGSNGSGGSLESGGGSTGNLESHGGNGADGSTGVDGGTSGGDSLSNQ